MAIADAGVDGEDEGWGNCVHAFVAGLHTTIPSSEKPLGFPTKLEHKTSPPALALTAVRVGIKAKENSDHFIVLELQAATFRLQWSLKVKSIGWPRDSCTHVFRKACEDRVRFHFLETERSLNIHRGGRRESILSMTSDGNAIPATSKDILSSPDPAAASTTSESLSLPFPPSSSSAARWNCICLCTETPFSMALSPATMAANADEDKKKSFLWI